MAKIEISNDFADGKSRSVECFEVMVWGTGGRADQQFSIGSGVNFNASGNFWIEIRHTIQEVPLVYNRSVIHYLGPHDEAGMEERLEKFIKGETDTYGFGDMLPEDFIILKREKYNSSAPEGENKEYSVYSLKVGMDLGAVLTQTPPGEHMLEYKFGYIGLEDGVRFMRELIREISEAAQGHHPDPGSLPTGHSRFPFAIELNRKAYDEISIDYKENYFANPRLKKAFDGWMKELPRGGHILDAGCGHGVPVITRLLKKGFQVTGSDFSPAMLERARKKFPRVSFREGAITDIEEESVFDGVCSFSSILYLDTIDLFNSIFRLYRALKPGGSLFLFGYDLHPTWRGVPLHEDLKHWMWGGTFSKEEISNALEEHGYFNVIKVEDVDTEKEREKRVEQVRLSEQKEFERLMGHFPSLNHMVDKIQAAEGLHLPEGFHLPENLSQLLPAEIPINSDRVAYPYVVVAEKNGKKEVPRE